MQDLLAAALSAAAQFNMPATHAYLATLASYPPDEHSRTRYEVDADGGDWEGDGAGATSPPRVSWADPPPLGARLRGAAARALRLRWRCTPALVRRAPTRRT